MRLSYRHQACPCQPVFSQGSLNVSRNRWRSWSSAKIGSRRDSYEAAKWVTMRRWLEANPDDEFAKDVRAKLTSEPEHYAAYTREYLGWGVFALIRR